MTKKNRVFLPPQTSYVCGHGDGRGNLLMGHEEVITMIEKNGVEYMTHAEYGPCSYCNDAMDERIEKQINEYTMTETTYETK